MTFTVVTPDGKTQYATEQEARNAARAYVEAKAAAAKALAEKAPFAEYGPDVKVYQGAAPVAVPK